MIELFEKSLLKQQKLTSLCSFIGDTNARKCLDIGGDNGVISYFLRKRGGDWTSCDLDDEAVRSIRALVKTNVYKIDGEKTPFPDRSFDIIVIIDFLEHIRTDRFFVRELRRIIKKNGTLIINVPYFSGRFSLLRTLKNGLKLTDEEHGHLRPGYDVEGLRGILTGSFQIERTATYIKFFSELIDVLVRFMSAKGGTKSGMKGTIVTGETLSKKRAALKLYSAIFPLLKLLSLLDHALFFTKGASLIVKAKPVPMNLQAW